MGGEDFDRTVYISACWFGPSLSATILGGRGNALSSFRDRHRVDSFS